jgi:hypothetical protein
MENSICHAQWQHWIPVTPISWWFAAVSSYSLLFSCLCNKYHTVFNSAACLLLNIIFKHSNMEQLKRYIKTHFPDAAVPNTSTKV